MADIIYGRRQTIETRNKIRESIARYRLQNPKLCRTKPCVICSSPVIGTRRTCSKECLSTAFSTGGRSGGKISAKIQTRRSKDEIALFELIASQIPSAIPNHQIVGGWDADIYLPEQRIAILWNGPWHYKELGISGHSLLQVQNRDHIKQKEFNAMGIRVFVFEDRYYTPQSAFYELVAAIGVEPILPVKDVALWAQ